MPESRPTPRTEDVMKRLREWCDMERGRRTAVAEWLDSVSRADGSDMRYPPQIITDWFSVDHQRMPTSEQVLMVIEFLNGVDLLEELSVWMHEEASGGSGGATKEMLALTNEKVAKQLKVSEATVEAWFAPSREGKYPTPNQIKAIAAFLERQKPS